MISYIRYLILYPFCYAAELCARRTASLLTDGKSTKLDHGSMEYEDIDRCAKLAAGWSVK